MKQRRNINKIIPAGFTLIEILLVIVIIGILAGIVFVMVGNGDNARKKAILATAKSVMPYAQECLFNRSPLNATPSNANNICANSRVKWPDISIESCSFGTSSSGNVYYYNIHCTNTSQLPLQGVNCSTLNGNCVEY